MRTQRTFRIAASDAYETSRRGLDVLEAPVLNKGSGFTLEERTQLGRTDSCMCVEECPCGALEMVPETI